MPTRGTFIAKITKICRAPLKTAAHSSVDGQAVLGQIVLCQKRKLLVFPRFAAAAPPAALIMPATHEAIC